MTRTSEPPDRELLELAAKAAGMGRLVWNGEVVYGGEYGAMLTKDGIGDRTWWNPITDDGDALRLAVTLRIDIELSIVNTGVIHAEWWDEKTERYEYAEERMSKDPYAATRRAIVRAAARLGADNEVQKPDGLNSQEDRK